MKQPTPAEIPAWIKLAAPDSWLKTSEIWQMFGYASKNSFVSSLSNNPDSFPKPEFHERGYNINNFCNHPYFAWRKATVMKEYQRRLKNNLDK